MISVLFFYGLANDFDHVSFWRSLLGVKSFWECERNGLFVESSLPPRTSTALHSHVIIVEWESSLYFVGGVKSIPMQKYLQRIREAGGSVCPIWFTGDLVSFWQGTPLVNQYLPRPKNTTHALIEQQQQ